MLLAAFAAFAAGFSLVLYFGTQFWPGRLARFAGFRQSVGLNQDPVAAPAAPGYWDRLEQDALAAGMQTWTARQFQQALVLGLGFGFLSFLFDLWLLGLLGVAGGLLGPRWVVNWRRRQRQERFAAQLSKALFLGANTMRAGGTLLQAVEAMATQMPAPLGEEFRIALQSIQLGTPAPEALEQLQARIGLKEFAAVTVVARVTSEVGGNPALAFERVAQSLLDAEGFRRTLKAYTTEGRMSAALVTGLPFLVMGVLALMTPEYFDPLFSTPAGRVVLATCLGAIALGWTLIRRITTGDDL